MQKILVPCDFSDQAISAFRLALDIARRVNGEVHLLHVIELPLLHDSMLMPTLSIEASMLDELRINAEERFRELKAQHASDHVSSKVEFGAIPVMILDVVRDLHIDLILMGTRGASGLREMLVGSNAERIVRRAPCPVIAVKKYEPVDALKHIVFPNSLEEKQDDLVARVKALQHFLQATLHVVWINTPTHFMPDHQTTKRLTEFAQHFMLKDFAMHIYNDRDEESGVINFAHSINAHIIAMGTHGRKGINHILSGSVAEDVVNHVDCAIWTYVKR